MNQLNKSIIRRYMLRYRENFVLLNKHCLSEISSLILKNFLIVLSIYKIKYISGFWPVKHEVNVKPLIYYLDKIGYKIVLPVIYQKILNFSVWNCKTKMVKDKYGIKIPMSKKANFFPEILLVPLLAFDETGNRLGYGKGYYDKYLSELRKQQNVIAVGVAYSCQRINKVPVNNYDENLDWVITEKEIFRFKQ